MSQLQPENPERRFHMCDALVLIASSALMLSVGRAVPWIMRSFAGWFSGGAALHRSEIRRFTCFVALASLSLPLLCSILIRPIDRNRLRRGVPGLFVHLAVATVVAVRLAGWANRATLFALLENSLGFYGPGWAIESMYDLQDDFIKDVVIAVLATWGTLKLVGRWNPERAWDDRLGRLVGFLWVLFYLGARLFLLLP